MAEHPDLKKWKDLATKQLRGKPLENLNWNTPEGILVKPLYTAEDLEGMPHVNTLPGFTRTRYRWTSGGFTSSPGISR